MPKMVTPESENVNISAVHNRYFILFGFLINQNGY